MDIWRSVDFLFLIDPDYCIIVIFMLFPNTEIFYEVAEKG